MTEALKQWNGPDTVLMADVSDLDGVLRVKCSCAVLGKTAIGKSWIELKYERIDTQWSQPFLDQMNQGGYRLVI